MKIFYAIYLHCLRILIQTPLLKWFGVSPIRIAAFRNSDFLSTEISKMNDRATIAFHAASAGELEILIPLIEAMRARNFNLVVTVFSDSALPTLKKINGLVYAGLSPREDEWGKFLDFFPVQKILISKYEAWPALWIECQKRKVPIVLINAQWRSSLAWAKRLVSFFGFSLPRLFLFATEKDQLSVLKNFFPAAEVFLSSDPRWVRVLERKEKSALHPKLQQWKNLQANAPLPYGMVGSAWLPDLELLVPALQKTDFKGTLWVVPHSLQPANLAAMKIYLQERLPGHFVLVNEMGFLTELYSLADWMWIGGGFGQGVHSTMEPAIYEKPLACGPNRSTEFPEIRELVAQGQLSLIHSAAEAESWLRRLPFQSDSARAGALDKKTADFAQSIEQWIQIR
jgi:3-deoxy-D-manno-octulosonic-acid transferase